MRTRTLGYTGEELTTIGLGTWAIGGGNWQFGWGPQDDQNSISSIHEALDLGINWIDTARVYGLGHSEEVVGRVLVDRREDVFVATKCGRHWRNDGTVFGKLEADSVRKECESSLRRLKVDTIDLYQIHWPDPDADIEEGWTELAKLAEEGKIRYAGVSNFSRSQLERVRPIHPVASLQPPYNMLERAVERDVLTYCSEHQIGVIAYSPMMSGLLTGKFTEAHLESLDEGDWRRRNKHFKESAFSVNLEFVDRLEPIAARNDLSLPQLSVAWVLRRPEVTSAIVGARRPGQIEETAAAGDVVLTKDDVREIEDLLEWREEAVSATI
jgi:aryl-alcohol dehydrogenase-like predicted oxidoreductase